MSENLTAQIKEYALDLGADLVGIADLDLVKGIRTIPEDLLAPFTRAVIVGIAYSFDVFEQIGDAPTAIYSRQQTTANAFLDQIGFLIQKKISNLGYHALAQPASLVIDKQDWWPNVSTKALARAAGLGWIGKNLLIITPQYGSRVRLVTILTDAPLEADPPISNRCGTCSKCVEACPTGAIRGVSWETYPASREVALEFAKCVAKLKDEFSPMTDIGQPICGICIKACPWSQRQPGL
jgi:epoxyqueuosine reductase